MPTVPRELLLGLDVGSSEIKALLVDAAGGDRGAATGPTPLRGAAQGVQMSVEVLRDAVAEVLGRLGPDRARVAGVGIAGMAESGAPLDARGRPLAPVIAWHDPRGGETVERLREHFGAELPARIGQPLRTVSSVAKLGWVLGHADRRPHRWLGVPELCLSELTGAQVTEHSLAARTGCYDVVARCWLPEVTDVLGLPIDVFPPVRAAGEVMGRVSTAGAAWSGLPASVPVTIAGHDHLAGAGGIATAPGDAVNSVGTAETVLRGCATPPDVARALALRLAVTVAPGGTGWVVLAGAARAGLVLDAASRALGRAPDELDALAERAGERVAGLQAGIDVDALRARIDERSPLELPAGPPGAVWNALLRALSARTAEATERLGGLLGPCRRMVVFGGGSVSDPWLRAKADALGLPVYRAAGRAAVARGAALTAGVAAGWWPHLTHAPLLTPSAYGLG